MVIWIEVRAIISMSLILWYNFVKCHSPTSISSADLFYFHWMTLTSSQIDTFHISRVFHRLIANTTPSPENSIFQMWLPSPCSSSCKSRSQRRQVPPMEAGRWTTHWMVHRATEHDSPERTRVPSWEKTALCTPSCMKDLMRFPVWTSISDTSPNTDTSWELSGENEIE